MSTDIPMVTGIAIGYYHSQLLVNSNGSIQSMSEVFTCYLY